MPDFPRSLSVTGLFGRISPTVKLRADDRITIFTGPNGSGKTHLLTLLRDTVGLQLRDAARLPFRALTVEYASGKTLSLQREQDDRGASLTVSATLPSGPVIEPVHLRFDEDPFEHLMLPSHIDRVEDELWMDRTDGELLDADDVTRRYGHRQGPRRAYLENPPWLDEQLPALLKRRFAAAALPTLIATGRLDLAPRPGNSKALPRRGRVPAAAARIQQYVDRIRAQVTEARRQSLVVSQRADREFASRALDKARATVKESELRARYESLATLHQELFANGLTPESMPLSIPPERTNPTERRILNIFLADWEQKLRTLEPVQQKLQSLRSIVGSKMQDKELRIDSGELHFSTANGEPIAVEALSSGEQHLLALFTMLLFYATPGSLVLIDEPEISLHAAWKHDFLSDIHRVAEINDLQVVLATHSTGIINGRWELVEELSLAL